MLNASGTVRSKSRKGTDVGVASWTPDSYISSSFTTVSVKFTYLDGTWFAPIVHDPTDTLPTHRAVSRYRVPPRAPNENSPASTLLAPNVHKPTGTLHAQKAAPNPTLFVLTEVPARTPLPPIAPNRPAGEIIGVFIGNTTRKITDPVMLSMGRQKGRGSLPIEDPDAGPDAAQVAVTVIGAVVHEIAVQFGRQYGGFEVGDMAGTIVGVATATWFQLKWKSILTEFVYQILR